MPIIYIHKEPKALEKRDDASDCRVLYLENRELVKLTFEMDDENAFVFFHQLPAHILPPLPNGYQWVRANDNYSIIRNSASPEHDVTIVLYGPDRSQYINFICQIDGRTSYSFAHTKNGKGPDSRSYPMSLANYRVPDYDYSTKKYQGHVRGHLIDHQDTILGRGTWSTNDRRNYVPEPPEYEWGLGFRRLKISELRKQRGGGAYAQLNMYPQQPLLTADHTPVPDDVRLYAYNKDNYQAKEVYHVEFEEDLTRPSGAKVLEYAATHFKTSLAASPVVAPYLPNFSDRSLRAYARSAAMSVQNIGTPLAPSRFIEKDKLYFSCESGDREFETAGRQLYAGIFAENDKKLSSEYLKRSMACADELSELEETEPFQEEDVRRGQMFFKGKGREMTGLADHFKQLCFK